MNSFSILKVGCPALAADIVQETWLRSAIRTLQQPVQTPAHISIEWLETLRLIIYDRNKRSD